MDAVCIVKSKINFNHAAHFLLICIAIVVLSSVLFEQGLDFFQSRIGLTVFKLFSALFFVIFVIIYNKKILIFKVKNSSIIFFIFYWIYSLIVTTFTVNIIDAIYSIVMNIFYGILFYFFYLLLKNRDINSTRAIFNVIGIISISVLLFFTFYTLITGEIIIDNYEGKFKISPFNDYNIFVFSLFVSLLLAFIGKFNGKKVIFYYILLLLFTLIALASGSRRAVAIYLPIMIFFPLFQFRLMNIIKNIFITIFSFFFVYLIFFNSIENKIENYDNNLKKSVEERIDRALSVFDSNSDSSGTRSIRWERAASIINDFRISQFIFGSGQRSFYSYPEFIREDGSKDHPHNFLLTSIIEGGVLKLLILLSFIILFLVEILKNEYYFEIKLLLIMIFFMWNSTVLISGEEYFMSKQFYILFLLFFLFKKRRSCIEKSNFNSNK